MRGLIHFGQGVQGVTPGYMRELLDLRNIRDECEEWKRKAHAVLVNRDRLHLNPFNDHCALGCSARERERGS